MDEDNLFTLLTKRNFLCLQLLRILREENVNPTTSLFHTFESISRIDLVNVLSEMVQEGLIEAKNDGFCRTEIDTKIYESLINSIKSTINDLEP